MALRNKGDVNWFDMAEVPYRASRMLKALGNPKAYALVLLLAEHGALEVDEIVRLLDRSKPAVSNILRALRDLEIVRYQRKGAAVIYTLKAPESLREILRRCETYVVEVAAMAEPGAVTPA
jgi:DNA-binding transcriptional ArsR family regulator